MIKGWFPKFAQYWELMARHWKPSEGGGSWVETGQGFMWDPIVRKWKAFFGEDLSIGIPGEFVDNINLTVEDSLVGGGRRLSFDFDDSISCSTIDSFQSGPSTHFYRSIYDSLSLSVSDEYSTAAVPSRKYMIDDSISVSVADSFEATPSVQERSYSFTDDIDLTTSDSLGVDVVVIRKTRSFSDNISLSAADEWSTG